MSDGNFNTKLLAPGGYASGVRAGEARMKQRAIKSLDYILDSLHSLSDEEAQHLKAEFKKRLDASTLGK